MVWSLKREWYLSCNDLFSIGMVVVEYLLVCSVVHTGLEFEVTEV